MNTPAAPARRIRTPRTNRRARRPVSLPFKALIAYADVPAARRAMSEIRDVLAASGRCHAFQPMLWRFDQLGRDNWAEVALRDATDAAIVVLASTEAGLDPAIERWVSQLMIRKQGTPVTIVAVLGATEAWTISIEKPQPVTLPAARLARPSSTLRQGVATSAVVRAA